MSSGLLDTNVFIHAHTTDQWSEECRACLRALEAGAVRAYLEPMVRHELSYALPHHIKQMTRDDMAAYLLMILGWDGVEGEKDMMVETVQRWQRTPKLAFVDAYLAVRAHERRCLVFTENAAELVRQGVVAPAPLPTGQPNGVGQS